MPGEITDVKVRSQPRALRGVAPAGIRRPWRFRKSPDIVNISLTEKYYIDKLYVMSKPSSALSQMPPSTVAALEQLGADLAVARLRRRESLKTWAKRIGISVPTLLRLEAGEPSVSLGVLATALWLIGRDQVLATLATPKEDRGALELGVRQAEALGQARVRATAQAKMKKASIRQTRQEGLTDAATGGKSQEA